jgi:deoxycytidylate deaminase/dephospho-CoA kinase
MAKAAQKIEADNTNASFARRSRQHLATSSAEIVIGLVGYAGSGCTAMAKSLNAALLRAGYKVHRIKLSTIIEKNSPKNTIPLVGDDIEYRGIQTLQRAVALQDAGDEIRKDKEYSLASLAIEEIIEKRGGGKIGEAKIAYILDSLKNISEVELLRDVYGSTFRLIALHCERSRRFNRLFGSLGSEAKFAGASIDHIERFMDRDEMDAKMAHGQQVRDVFHLADYFIDDNVDEKINVENNDDLKRFFEILLGANFHRPRPHETAMYTAFSAALRSSCLSRQVGAALVSSDDQIIAIGSNDVPKFGGGTYLEGSFPDHRCAYWSRTLTGGGTFIGCHNTRHKNYIEKEISEVIRVHIGAGLAASVKKELGEASSGPALSAINAYFDDHLAEFSPPKVRDLLEFSRSIHAEMDALFSAARQGKSTLGTTVFCTTFPCHNCARHMVTAGVKAVYYVEPYVKSLAVELHADSIRISDSERPGAAATDRLAVHRCWSTHV